MAILAVLLLAFIFYVKADAMEEKQRAPETAPLEPLNVLVQIAKHLVVRYPARTLAVVPFILWELVKIAYSEVKDVVAKHLQMLKATQIKDYILDNTHIQSEGPK